MSLRNRAETAVSVLLATCALVLTTIVLVREIRTIRASSIQAQMIEVRDWHKYVVPDARLGPADAAVTMVIFSDFQCPYCAKLAATIDSLVAKYPRDIALVYRHFPISTLHPLAFSAAIASECAREQGRFKEYHDLLFANQSRLRDTIWQNLARSAAIGDTTRFRLCMERSAYESRVRTDSIAGHRLGVTGTPTLLINRWLVVGAKSTDELALLIEREINEVHP